jgi:hypothetical protein
MRQKSEHSMHPPTTSYHHGYSSYQCRSSTGVKSYFLLPIPGWEVKTCHCTHHTMHYFTTDHPRGRISQGLYPTISGIWPYPPVLDPILDLASTQPRLTIGQQGEKADVAQDSRSFHCLVLYVTMVSRDGRPFPRHDATATSIGIDKTSLLRHPGIPASSYPIKGQAGALQGQTENERTNNEKPVSIPPENINISSNLLCTLIFPLRPGLGSLSHSL